MKTVLVVGGAGYIGSHTSKLLSKSGYKVVIFDNLSTGYEKLSIYGTLVVGDLSNQNEIDAVFKEYKIDIVFHFAAYSCVGESVLNPQKYYKNNVQNTLNLLDAMLENNVKKIIFSSTCAVYGVPKYLPLDENHSTNPINPYGKTKLIVENILEDYDKAYALKYVILRYFNAAGADADAEIGEMHDPESHLIPLAIKALDSKGHKLQVFGDDYDTKDGSCVRDYIHVEDLANAHLKAYEYLLKNNNSDIFNLGTETAYSVFDIIKTIQKLSSKKMHYTVSPRREGDPDSLLASSKKAYEILGWRATSSSIEKIIKSALKWHQKD
ncbi:MAG: UDP-glucose 4-epimerase GalE [Arcobacteraceae bacterium]